MIGGNSASTPVRMSHPLLPVAVIALYAVAAVVLALRLGRHLPAGGGSRAAALGTAAAAVILHAVLVWKTTWQADGLNLRLFNAASLIGWVISALLVTAASRRPLENLGVILFPLVALTVALQWLLGVPQAVTTPRMAPVDTHVLLSVLAYSVLGIAAAQSLLLAVQEHQLRHRHPGGFLRLLPALQDMERLLFTMLRVGFVLLTASLATGWLFVSDLFAQHLVHKTVLTMLAWVLFAVLLAGRWRFGWRGQTAARGTMAAFLVLAVGYFGSKFVLELLLGA
ncbi:cytochrome C assembly family protein [Arhodomonas sp. SL1]|uniref:cytochrome C assembly family protein n=1 Tax=Arhodomonas sp. SL1 TaxID=3425691 RepID=UPI003F884AFE